MNSSWFTIHLVQIFRSRGGGHGPLSNTLSSASAQKRHSSRDQFFFQEIQEISFIEDLSPYFSVFQNIGSLFKVEEVMQDPMSWRMLESDPLRRFLVR